jgi:oxygen-independent coproporphyrinogen-3 oxidase
MIAIYLHIPFCKQACHYCNFHFSTNLSGKSAFVKALLTEINARKDEFPEQEIASIYLGGGTPSLLDASELNEIFNCLYRTFKISTGAEITLEANPDDIHSPLLKVWKAQGINRLSLGIQSFHAEALKWMHRAHDHNDALYALDLIASAGFKNVSADLMYGVPGVTDEQWQRDILALTDRKIPHISAYCLTVEDQTALAHFVKKGTSPAVEEEQANRQWDLLMDLLEEKGYVHYEISNFAFPGMEAKHNSSYWLGMKYMGFGSSAHSYDGISRYWNLADNRKYTAALLSGRLPPKEVEILTKAQQFNEYILTRLRTHWGVHLKDMSEPFKTIFLKEVKAFIPEMIYESSGAYFLTKKGKRWVDYLTGQLFVSEA